MSNSAVPPANVSSVFNKLFYIFFGLMRIISKCKVSDPNLFFVNADSIKYPLKYP